MGVSSLASTLDLVNCIPIDYMHAVLEGVVHQLMKFWFNSNYHLQPFYLRDCIDELGLLQKAALWPMAVWPCGLRAL